MTHKQQILKKAKEEYTKKFGLCDEEGKSCSCFSEIKFIEKLISTTYDKAYEKGMRDMVALPASPKEE